MVWKSNSAYACLPLAAELDLVWGAGSRGEELQDKKDNLEASILVCFLSLKSWRSFLAVQFDHFSSYIQKLQMGKILVAFLTKT